MMEHCAPCTRQMRRPGRHRSHGDKCLGETRFVNVAILCWCPVCHPLLRFVPPNMDVCL